MKKLIVILAALFVPAIAYSAKQVINNGETMGQARTKINANFTEVYGGLLIGDCTAFPCYDGTANSGTLIKLMGVDGVHWSSIQAGNVLANINWRLPLTLPGAGTTRLVNADEYGNMGLVDAATLSAASMTVVASGFDGNLATTDDTLQEIAQKLDDLNIAGGGFTNLTQFITQTPWRVFYSDGSGDVKELALGADGEYLKSNGASAVPSWSTPTGGAHDAVTLGTDADVVFGLSTQQLTLDSQTANYFFAAPNGSAGDPTFRAIVAADIPILNQNTTGSAATLTTARTIAGTSFNGSANIDISYSNLTNKPTLGTSAQYNVGTSIGDIVRIADSGGNPALPFTLSLFDLTANSVSLDPPTTTGSWMTFAATTGAASYLTPGTGVGTFLTTPSSANLVTAITDETGSSTGTPLLVFNQSPRIDNIELGAASDTTLSRSAAGVIAVEGVNVLMGALGSTDNVLLRSNGTGGSTAQGSGIDIDDSNNITVPGNISSNGSITGLMPSKVISSPSGTHDGSSNVATLSDSGESFTTNAYVGMTLYNITDGSSCTVTANNATTMTCTLSGGTDNDWDASDAWQVGPGPYQSGSWFYVTNAGTIRHPSTAGYQVCYESDAAAVLTVDMASSSMIFQGVLDSAVTALDAGDSIDSSGSTTGDFQCIHNKSTTEAQGKGKRGTWVDGGAT